MKEFFTVHGRMRRKTYFLYVIACYGVTLIPIFIMFNLPSPYRQSLSTLMLWILLFVSLATHTVLLFATMKRLHDIDMTGKAAFFVFVAPISSLMVLWLLYQSYNDLGGVNQYGPNPRESVEIREEITSYPPLTW